MSPDECLESIKSKFSQIYNQDVLWQEIVANLSKKRTHLKYLRKQRNKAMGSLPILSNISEETLSSKSHEIKR